MRSCGQRSICRHRHHFFSSDSFSPQRWRHACKNVVDRRAGQGPFEYQRIGDGLDLKFSRCHDSCGIFSCEVQQRRSCLKIAGDKLCECRRLGRSVVATIGVTSGKNNRSALS